MATTYQQFSSGLAIEEGSNKTSGIATLVGGTVTVSTSKVTANSRIHLTPQSVAGVGAVVAIGVSDRTAGVSFDITSANVLDTSDVDWMIVEPV